MKDEIKIYEIQHPTCQELTEEFILSYSGEHKPRMRYTEAKFHMLLHTIIKRQMENFNPQDNTVKDARLDSVVLTKIYGEIYVKILSFLIEKGIVYRTPYKQGKAFGYSICYEDYPFVEKHIPLSEWQSTYKHEEHFLHQTREYFSKRQQGLKQEYADIFDNGNTAYIERYLKDLSCLKIKDTDEFYKDVETLDYQTMADEINAKKSKRKKKHKKTTPEYLRYCYHEIASRMNSDTLRWSYDERGRIYSRLTNSPRILRGHYNIQFSIDNHNSQPLLFSTLLTKKYKISKSLLEIFCDICLNDEEHRQYPIDFDSTNTEQPFAFLELRTKYSWYEHLWDENFTYSKELRKCVKRMNKIPSDVWNYLYVTMNGTFWNMFVEGGISRDEAKATLFENVFYRRKTKKGKVVKIHGECGSAFEAMFPNVAKTITKIISEHEESWLPNEMTRVESRLMKEILKRVWKLGFTAVTLHDAIEVIKLPKGMTLDEGKQKVKDCFHDVFLKREHILCAPDE